MVTTTIDPTLQTAGVEAVRDVVTKDGAHRNVSQGALVSLAPDGAILAMVGGLDHGASAFNRVVQARRQPGSSFKAFVYGAAMEHGLTPMTVRDDAPISYGNWTPENYGHSYARLVTLVEALRPVAEHRLGAADPGAFLATATVADFAQSPSASPTSRPIPAPRSRSALATRSAPWRWRPAIRCSRTGGGADHALSGQRSCARPSGDVLYSHVPSRAPTPVMDPLYATRMIDMLKAVVTGGTGTSANIGRPMAGKTGTSQNWRDAWFVGFTPDILTAVSGGQ